MPSPSHSSRFYHPHDIGWAVQIFTFFLPANKHPTSCGDVFKHRISEAAKLGVNVFPTIVYADFETAIHNAVTTMWPIREVKTCCFRLGQSWCGKYNLWDSAGTKSVLEDNIRTVVSTTGRSQPLICGELYIQSPERQASGRVLRLLAIKLYWCRLHFSCTCLVRMYCVIMRTINACETFHVHFNALFYRVHHKPFVLVSALQKVRNETHIKMRSVTTRRLKKSATLKKEDLISSKTGQYRVNLISRIEFVSSVSYKFLPNTHL